MGRPQPSNAQPTAMEPGYGGEARHAMGSPVPFPPTPMPNNDAPQHPPMAMGNTPAPYPPPATMPQHPPVATGTPVSFPPAGRWPAAAPQQMNGGGSPYPLKVGKPWTSGLFDCDQNSTNAVLTAFFPCVTFGQIAEILDEGQTSCTLGSFMHGLLLPVLACSILGTSYRQKLRLKYNLVQAPAEDWSVHLFCPCCALCQEYRELQNRGIDPSIGWMGYLAQQQEASMVPPAVHSMNQ
ncbi:protein PLANT CADMIUM RESISTANCE 7-like [Phoenix dactylifera]|uniref:Protein PLANT CADMIUM RESISTANCE 7-like n=1 Tax=Phoenix dactylifera TaxID=42345 RepID=A0A8B9ANX5_PHODC|nr:protein PLANT CADMIUM RESISTANCE 7-like [Phoenix dactylifera]XP_038985015.1 protein PLANT CADMIUM RESISTANCE 7-like [Phoenix dactylifera]XP_038985016.1 protein PLANT CADMIUM RESISTANCE 7-like [Phoenix dactylifera]